MRPLLLALAAKHRGIQIQREAAAGTPEQPQQPAPERTPENLNVGLGKPQEKVADGVITGKPFQSQQGVQDPVRAQPLAVGEALGTRHHRHHKRRERMRQRNGVVGSRLGKRHGALHLAGKTNLAEERNETGQPAKRRDGLGRFRQNQLGIAEKCGSFVRSRFVQGRVGLFKHQSLCPQAFPQSDSFLISEFGFRQRPAPVIGRA